MYRSWGAQKLGCPEKVTTKVFIAEFSPPTGSSVSSPLHVQLLMPLMKCAKTSATLAGRVGSLQGSRPAQSRAGPRSPLAVGRRSAERAAMSTTAHMLRSSLSSRAKAGRPARLEKNHPEGGADEDQQKQRGAAMSTTAHMLRSSLSSREKAGRPARLEKKAPAYARRRFRSRGWRGWRKANGGSPSRKAATWTLRRSAGRSPTHARHFSSRTDCQPPKASKPWKRSL